LIVSVRPARLKIIDQMGNDMCGTGLSRELKVLAIEHMTIQTQAEFHNAYIQRVDADGLISIGFNCGTIK
jgi:hypothetical protein